LEGSIGTLSSAPTSWTPLTPLSLWVSLPVSDIMRLLRMSTRRRCNPSTPWSKRKAVRDSRCLERRQQPCQVCRLQQSPAGVWPCFGDHPRYARNDQGEANLPNRLAHLMLGSKEMVTKWKSYQAHMEKRKTPPARLIMFRGNSTYLNAVDLTHTLLKMAYLRASTRRF
jgi:hypothetical protein